MTGNKARAIAAARDAGLPVLSSSAPSASVDELVSAAEGMDFPLFVKSVSGGGGGGMRRVTDPEALPEAIEAASRVAESAFGDPTVYLEQPVVNPRHIEVQIRADRHGNVMHPVRAQLQRAAAPPEGHRNGACVKPFRTVARPNLR